MCKSALLSAAAAATMGLIAWLPLADAHVLRPARKVTVQGTAPLAQTVKPRLFFLFMADDQLSNHDIWASFFKDATKGIDYDVFLHCKDLAGCLLNHPRLADYYTPIPTVPSSWCVDLVSPMNALLAAAVNKSSGQGPVSNLDKFIFVSHNSVPVKPFSYVQHKLIVKDQQKSNFCVREWPSWAWYKGKYALAKHSQWMILSRAHAEKSLHVADKISPAHLRRQMTPFRWMGSESLPRALWELRKHVVGITHSPLLDAAFSLILDRGCTDEHYHFAAVIGALDPKKLAKADTKLNSLSNGELTMREDAKELQQGVCDTYAVIENIHDNFTESLLGNRREHDTKLGGRSEFLRPNIHAGSFFTLSERSLVLFRGSEYLFMRKVDNHTQYDGNMSLLQAFNTLVLHDSHQSRS